MADERRIVLTQVVGAHTHGADGTTFVVRDEAGEVALECDAQMVAQLLGLCLQNTEVTYEHDGFRIGVLDGQPSVSFRFGQGRWLSILLTDNDFEVLRTARMPRPPSAPSGGSERGH